MDVVLRVLDLHSPHAPSVSNPGVANIRFRRKGDGQVEILAYPGEDAKEVDCGKPPRLGSNGTRLHINSLQVESHGSQTVAASRGASSDLCLAAGKRLLNDP